MEPSMRLLPVIFIPVILLVSGCISGFDAETLAKLNPIIQDFLNDHPNAEILATHFTENQSSQIIEDIRAECANPMIEPKEFYRVRFTEEDTGFYAVVWIDWEARQIECAFKKGEAAEQIENCSYHAIYKCFGQHVYWFDSCGYKQDKKEYCEHGCRDGRCIDKQTCEEIGGYCIYPTTTVTGATGMVTGAPTGAIEGCVQYHKCPDGSSVRYCEEVKKFDDKGIFIGIHCVCKEYPEYLCPVSSGPLVPILVDVCDEGYYKTDHWCPDGGICCAPGEIQCKSHAEHRCYGGHVYWFDSCGHRQEKKEYCQYGCELGFCKTTPMNFCGTSTEGPCQNDSGCMIGGCSGQVCQSTSEDPITTDCLWKDCYSDEKFGMVCSCVEGECRWKKECPVEQVICEEGSEIEVYIGEDGCEHKRCILPTDVCTDSDGGKTYFEAGYVTKGSATYEDHCNEDGTLTEKYCENNEVKAIKVECEQGYVCNGGKCINVTVECAEEGEQFSGVYTNEYPEHCCEGLTEWEAGMDTRISIADECYETGLLAGSPVGRCIECGNQVCEEYENPCNCPDDCVGKNRSTYLTVDAFCDGWGYLNFCEHIDELNLELCSLCETNQTV
ncbi:MAG: eight-cysteine-cluster domain-containing protein, partial [Candidatus Aenigmatarchaeota archaeon]